MLTKFESKSSADDKKNIIWILQALKCIDLEEKLLGKIQQPPPLFWSRSPSSFFYWGLLSMEKSRRTPGGPLPYSLCFRLQFPVPRAPRDPQDRAGADVWQSRRAVAEGGEVSRELFSRDVNYSGGWCGRQQVAVGGTGLPSSSLGVTAGSGLARGAVAEGADGGCLARLQEDVTGFDVPAGTAQKDE